MEHTTHSTQTASAPTANADANDAGQQHPLGIYFKIWGLLFVLSTLSYMVDYLGFQGLPRWSLILIFMVMKAGLIVSVFMHMVWERLALVYAILIPPLCLIALVGLMTLESDYTFWTRILFFETAETALPVEGH